MKWLAFALVIVCTCVGCAKNRELVKEGPCVRNAHYQYTRYQSKGYLVREVSGYYKDTPHRWCERYEDGEWLLCKDTVGNYAGKYEGWPTSAYGDYRVRRIVRFSRL